MATELAKAYVQIIPSADGIKGKLSEALGGEASSAGDSAGKSAGFSLASSIKKVIVAAGIGTALKTAISEGADMQQSLGGIETLFKDSSNKVIENAKNAYKTAGLSANAYMETVTGFSASLLQGLAGDTDKAADVADMALTDMADNANKMGTSMDLIQNAYQGFAKQNYTMLDNLKLGYGGTKTEMERLLSDATKISGIEYNLDNLSDVYEAIHVIQGELDITGTTAKEAASTLSGSLAAMKSAFSNVLGNLTLGEDIGPSLQALGDTVFTFITGNLVPMVGNILSNLPEVLDSALSMAVRGLNIAAENADTLVQNGIDLIGELVVGIISALPYLAEAAVNIVTGLGSAIINTDWVGVATDIINKLRDNMALASSEILGTDGSIIQAVSKSITEKLPEVLKNGIEITSNIANGILQNLPNIITSIGSILSQMLDFIMQNLPSILQAGGMLLKNLALGILNNLPTILTSIAQVLANLIATILRHMPQILQTGIELLGKLAAGIIKAIPKLVAQLPTVIENIVRTFGQFDWKEIGLNIIRGIANGIANAAGAIIDAAKEAARSALDAAKSALGIHSPSRLFENEVGKMIDMGLAAGIKNNVGAVSDSMKEISSATIGMVDTDFSVKNGAPAYASEQNSNQILSVIMQVFSILYEYLPQMANMQVVLDSGATIGQLASGMDEALGKIAARNERWI